MKYILTIFICILCTLSVFANETTGKAVQSSENAKQEAIYNTPLIETDKLKDEINRILKGSFPDAQVLSFKQIPQNGTIVYECNVSYQGSVIKLYINPQNGAITGKIDDKELFNEKITKSGVSKGTKEVNNILKQIKLDASFNNVKYNKKDKTIEGNILYSDTKYYFKMNTLTGEIIEMTQIDN